MYNNVCYIQPFDETTPPSKLTISPTSGRLLTDNEDGLTICLSEGKNGTFLSVFFHDKIGLAVCFFFFLSAMCILQLKKFQQGRV